MKIKRRFMALRGIAFLFMLGAVLALIGGIGMAIMIATGGTALMSEEMGAAAALGPVGGALIVAVYGFFMFLGLLAYAELLQLMVAVEENTRATAAWLAQQQQEPEAMPQPQPTPPATPPAPAS